MKSARSIRLIAFDVDGTLTDGCIALGPAGECIKLFSARDGLAMSAAHRLGYKIGCITGRKSEIVSLRGKELHLDFVLMDVGDKISAMHDVLKQYGLSWDAAAYMGDDLNDLPLFGHVGFAGCPKNACAECLEQADFVSARDGGHGAAREFLEYILKSQDHWKDVVDSFMKR